MVKDNFTFKEIVDIEKLRILFESFTVATGFTTGLVDQQTNEVLIGTGWRDICTKFHRACEASLQHCKSSNKKLTSGMEKPGEIRIDYCENGLIDGSTPIIVEGKHLANLFTGQILFAPPDMERFKNQAKKFDYDEKAYLKALKKVLVVDENIFRAKLNFLALLATMVAEIGLTELRTQRTNENISKQRALLDSLINSIPDLIFYKDKQGVYLGGNKAFEKYANHSVEDIIGKTDFDIFPKEMAQSFCKNDSKMLEEGKCRRNEEWVEYPNGDKVLLDTLKTPYYSPDGTVLGLIGVSRNITQMEKAKDDLKKSEKRYREIFENSPDLISIHNMTEIVYINKSGLNILGAESLDEVVGKSAIDFVHPDDRAMALESIKKLFTRVASKIVLEQRFIRLDGKVIDIELIGVPFIYENESMVQITGRDITERKLAAKEIRKLSKLVDTINQAVIITDLQANITYVNQALLKIGGFDAEKELIGKSIFLFSDTAGVKQFQQEVIPALLEENKYMGEIILKRKDNSYFPAEIYCSTILDETGNPEYLVAMFDDITERKNTENKILRLATVVDQASQVIVITDLKGNIEYVNPAFEKSTGYTFAEAKGQNPRILKDDEQSGDFYEELWFTIRSGKTWQGIFNNKKKDGTKYFERAVIFPIKDINGKITNFAAIKQDISNEKILEAQLQHSQRMESIGTLAGGIAHDFNNILFPILGYTEMLLADVPEDSPFRNSLNGIYTGALRARDLVKQILTFARKENYEFKLLKIQPVIREALKLIRSTIPTTIDIIDDIRDECGVVKADPTQIHQILMNLTTNAYHAMEKTGGELKVTLEELQIMDDPATIHPDLRPGTYACLSVSDTGVGMDQELTKKIFDPFFTTKGLGKGTGMGLSVVHGIVTGMNGVILTASEPGKGTRFIVYFPVEKKPVEMKDLSQKMCEALKSKRER